ncbi:hypothetical protein [Corallococcus aberystwythensis]|uniref:Uncharacterized protein n=1 Tax=Corallococcus aberystwythensis TaxID=2316722 RepID=A0A3A8QC27_9BACT|nr:hypothetical protein [Corallococcus aberystwythensis]RKH66243.1 hypothetical protein D7W81_15795 [Corallococcus aberystwythensis]
MSGLTDRTGTFTRWLGLGGLLALVATAVVLKDPPPAPAEPRAAPSGPQVALPPAPPLPEPAGSRVRRVFPPFPGAVVIPMGRLEANGSPMELGYFETDHPPGEVLEFYAREFRLRGRNIVTQDDGAGGGAVNYYDERLGAMVSVTTIRVGGATTRTLVFPSLVEAPEGIHLQGTAPASLPQPPGAVTVLRVDEQGTGRNAGSTTLTQVAHGTPRMLAEFYQAQMPSRGYKPSSQRLSKGVEMLDFERSGERVSLSLAPLDKDGPPESLITFVVERASPPPPQESNR